MAAPLQKIPSTTHPPEMGRWWKTLGGSLVLSCPACGFIIPLDHEISPSGIVRPKVECPVRECGFAEALQLEDWGA